LKQLLKPEHTLQRPNGLYVLSARRFVLTLENIRFNRFRY